ncbi:CsxC family protein [Desulfosporosinus sp. FKA]|uniref:CsxC family protein n=1 Tax=Desulfosporosinus sp. FKA TaxID=1969834 RepID=UPI000B4A267B|nr:hypothetical protein [Desulfosporosinus sp. FKA]
MPSDPNPAFITTASLVQCAPLAVTQTAPGTIYVTVSIPAESVITLPTPALEIKRVSKMLKITQCRFFNPIPPIAAGKPADTAKLFLGGFVRKDIQYTEVTAGTPTPTTVAGTIRDFVIDIPVSCVANLGTGFALPPQNFDQEQIYEYFNSSSLPSGFSPKDKLLSGDLSEFNVVSNKFLNVLPTCELVYSQINEMDDALNRVPLAGGPFEEGTFTTLQEKMVVVAQVKVTFPTVIDP